MFVHVSTAYHTRTKCDEINLLLANQFQNMEGYAECLNVYVSECPNFYDH